MIAALIIASSPEVRRQIHSALERDHGLAVLSEAASAADGLTAFRKYHPDVVLVCTDLPAPDLLQAIDQIMGIAPKPVLVLDPVQPPGDSGLAFEALQHGAVEVLRWPPAEAPGSERSRKELPRLLRLAASVKLVRRTTPIGRQAARAAVPPAGFPLVGIGASTGGPPALAQVLGSLPQKVPASLLVVQHMTEGFTENFAAWLRTVVQLQIRIPRDGEPLQAGTVYLAPENHHLAVSQGQRARIHSDPPVGGLRPSATVLFESLARCTGVPRVGILLTGIGDDGAQGLLALRRSGGHTIAQDEASSVVYGMPKAAAEMQAADEVLSLPQIGPRLSSLVDLHQHRLAARARMEGE